MCSSDLLKKSSRVSFNKFNGLGGTLMVWEVCDYIASLFSLIFLVPIEFRFALILQTSGQTTDRKSVV